jgi:hypothetical protein
VFQDSLAFRECRVCLGYPVCQDLQELQGSLASLGCRVCLGYQALPAARPALWSMLQQ